MGNLFHEPVGTSLTQAQWEATGTNTGKHLFGPTVAVGDIPYAAASATTGAVLSSLAIGSSGQVLTVSAGVPSWQNAAVSYTDASAVAAINASGVVLAAGKNIRLFPVTANGTYSGLTMAATSSVAVTAGQVGFFNASAQFATGCATAVAKMPITHIAVENIASGSAGVFLSYGYYANNGFSLLVAGKPAYAATGVNIASMSSAIPATGTSGCVQVVGMAYSTTGIFFNPDMTVIELV